MEELITRSQKKGKKITDEEIDEYIKLLNDVSDEEYNKVKKEYEKQNTKIKLFL